MYVVLIISVSQEIKEININFPNNQLEEISYEEYKKCSLSPERLSSSLTTVKNQLEIFQSTKILSMFPELSNLFDILLNLINSKITPFIPGLSCRKKIGLPSTNQIIIDNERIIGIAKTSNMTDKMISSILFI